MIRNGLKFVVVVKTTRKFPMSHISQIELINRGDTSGLANRKKSDSDGCYLLSYVWMGIDGRYFFAFGSSLSEGITYRRVQTRQVNQEENADP